MRTFVGLCLVLLWSMPATGRTVFVDNMTGDDHFAGRQPQRTPDENGPVRTIAQAVRLADGGDTIVLAKTAQPYQESFTLVGSRSSGLSGRPFTLRGNGAILDGSAPVPVEAWESYGGAVFRFRPPRMGPGQLFLDGRPAVRVPVSQSATRPPDLKAREWCLLGGQFFFRVDPTKLPRDYKLSYARQQTGITLFHVDDVRIVDLTVQGFRVDGIQLQNSAKNVTLVGVTCRGNGRSGITVGGVSSLTLRQSMLGDNGTAQLLTLPYSETNVYDSHLLRNSAPGWVDQGGRVFFGGQRRQGGLNEFHPVAIQEKTP
jgi:hypothetical protein